MPAGSVMLFVGSIYHGGGANTTDKARLGVILEFCAGWVRPQENHVLGVPKEIVAGLDPRLQELLGYTCSACSATSTAATRRSTSTTSARSATESWT